MDKIRGKQRIHNVTSQKRHWRSALEEDGEKAKKKKRLHSSEDPKKIAKSTHIHLRNEIVQAIHYPFDGIAGYLSIFIHSV